MSTHWQSLTDAIEDIYFAKVGCVYDVLESDIDGIYAVCRGETAAMIDRERERAVVRTFDDRLADTLADHGYKVERRGGGQ